MEADSLSRRYRLVFRTRDRQRFRHCQRCRFTGFAQVICVCYNTAILTPRPLRFGCKLQRVRFVSAQCRIEPVSIRLALPAVCIAATAACYIDMEADSLSRRYRLVFRIRDYKIVSGHEYIGINECEHLIVTILFFNCSIQHNTFFIDCVVSSYFLLVNNFFDDTVFFIIVDLVPSFIGHPIFND